jgi:hypothetical protein
MRYGEETIFPGDGLFVFSEEDEDRILCNMDESRLNSLLDELASVGIVRFDRELIYAEEILSNEEAQWPSKDYAELGSRVLAHATGIRVFMISDLGTQFWHATQGTSLI